MKTIKISIMVFALMIGVAGALTTHAASHHAKAATSLFWYPVDPSTNETTDAFQFDDTKSNVIAEQSCKDGLNQPICLFGSTNSNVAVGTNVGTPPAADRILETHP